MAGEKGGLRLAPRSSTLPRLRRPQPRPRYLRLRLLHLVLRLHQLFVDLLQPGCPDLGGGAERVSARAGTSLPPRDPQHPQSQA